MTETTPDTTRRREAGTPDPSLDAPAFGLPNAATWLVTGIMLVASAGMSALFSRQ